jgi:hypothetical protein
MNIPQIDIGSRTPRQAIAQGLSRVLPTPTPCTSDAQLPLDGRSMFNTCI